MKGVEGPQGVTGIQGLTGFDGDCVVRDTWTVWYKALLEWISTSAAACSDHDGDIIKIQATVRQVEADFKE